MLELFRAVERNLKRIDEMLNDASAGDAPLSAVEDAGLDDLLKDTQASSKSVVQDIDRILELARQRGQQQQSQGQSQGEPQQGDGQSPLDQARDRGPREGESTPEKPTDGQEKPEDKQGQKPDSPAGTDADEWGMLPAKVRRSSATRARATCRCSTATGSTRTTSA
jgi:hypothetical protein